MPTIYRIPVKVASKGLNMISCNLCLGHQYSAAARARIGFAAICCAAILSFTGSGAAQEPQPPQQPGTTQQPAVPPAAAPTGTAPPAPSATQEPEKPAAAQVPSETTQPAQPLTPGTATPAAESQPSASSPETPQPGAITEETLRQMLIGKPLYLRGGFLDNSLSFNENGGLIGHSPQGSYTLSAIQIDKVHLTKHKVELEGARYGLHFLGALPYEDPTKALDRVKITPKKKVVKITIDRELVVTPKKKKQKGNGQNQPAKAAAPSPGAPSTIAAGPAAAPSASVAPSTVAASDAAPAQTKPADTANPPSASPAPQAASANDQPSPPPAPVQKELSDADQAKADMAAAPVAERPADPSSVTTTTSPAHAAKLLKSALDKIFAPGLDDRMMAAMPDFWKLYYQAVAAKADYRPKDPSVLRQNTVDKKAVLLSKFEPPSNEWAQASGIAGPALYHAVIQADGKPGEIAVARPIGFGLDESAVDSIRKANFEPAIKDGKPVPVMLDLYVSFRIYSNRTAANSKPDAEAEDKKAEKQLPGPYSLKPVSE